MKMTFEDLIRLLLQSYVMTRNEAAVIVDNFLWAVESRGTYPRGCQVSTFSYDMTLQRFAILKGLTNAYLCGEIEMEEGSFKKRVTKEMSQEDIKLLEYRR